MRGPISEKRGSQPRWPEKAEGMETSKLARKRKLDTAKTDLKPPLAVLRRAGCPLCHTRSSLLKAGGPEVLEFIETQIPAATLPNPDVLRDLLGMAYKLVTRKAAPRSSVPTPR